ncbi:hypothetical protein PV327_004386 [Microctonus hyperodae]|uniref:Protein CUSTOS n=1 Tax=Microctonus hyperodae TaxID=165561 RepID=A0AA39FCB4_MICHY|nr:hypothetical protein PV327_004386 [Microctonus hyperodae]
MADNDNDSSSTDDENIKEALREATDSEFLHNYLFNNENSKTNISKHDVPSVVTKIKPSSRLHSEKADIIEGFGVTQSYKDFVAKKLYEFLERNIKFKKMDTENIVKKTSGGIKLLSSSINMLSHDEIVPNNTHSNKRRKTKDNSAENKLKCQEVAVNPELIITQAETKAWNQRQKGTVFKYKKKSDGTLVEEQ